MFNFFFFGLTNSSIQFFFSPSFKWEFINFVIIFNNYWQSRPHIFQIKISGYRIIKIPETILISTVLKIRNRKIFCRKIIPAYYWRLTNFINFFFFCKFWILFTSIQTDHHILKQISAPLEKFLNLGYVLSKLS